MGVFELFGLRVPRGEGRFFAGIRSIVKTLLRSNLPLPTFLRPFYRALYHLHFLILYACRWTLNYFYREPAFRSRCTSVGRNLHLWLMPDVTGHAEIHIGNDVNLFGFLEAERIASSSSAVPTFCSAEDACKTSDRLVSLFAAPDRVLCFFPSPVGG